MLRVEGVLVQVLGFRVLLVQGCGALGFRALGVAFFAEFFFCPAAGNP